MQAETLGTSVGQVLRVQAQQMRMRRRQRAEQMARQAPVKMVFPLVFFLMPSLFIVTIGPVVLAVIQLVPGKLVEVPNRMEPTPTTQDANPYRLLQLHDGAPRALVDETYWLLVTSSTS